MKKIYTYLREICLFIALLVLATAAGWGQDGYDPETGKLILGPELNRRALVRPNCIVTTMYDIVKVLGQASNMNNVLDQELSNAVAFESVAEVGVALDELIRVKDMKNYYKAGTTVGFCIEASETSLLSLDLLKMFEINFYKDGDPEPIGSAMVNPEAGGGLLGVSLIQLPSEAVTMLSVKAPDDLKGGCFDEIGLGVAGISLDVLSTLKIRYAFVGDAQEYRLIDDNAGEGAILGNDLNAKITDGVSAWNVSEFIDDNYDNGVVFSRAGKASITLTWDNLFQKGTEVGFNYTIGGLASIDAGAIGHITLYKNGEEVDDVNLETSVLKISALSGERTTSSIIAKEAFNSVKFTINAGFLGITGILSGVTFHYGFVNKSPEILGDCHIEGITMDASICGNETTYELRPIKDVEWSLTKVTNSDGQDITSQVQNNLTWSETDTTKVVSGLKMPGEYTFTATKKNEDGTIACTEDVILKHGMQTSSDCNMPVTDLEYELAPSRGFSGGIGISTGIRNRENIINDNYDDYADIDPNIMLLNNQFVIGVRKKNGNISDGNEKRIGFLVDLPNTFLNANVLQFFYIKLYDSEGKEVESYTVQDWNVISAALIGSLNSSKMRLGITVPVDVEFCEYSLWTGGVAAIQLSSMRIYSAFVENASANCDNPLSCDAVMVGSGALSNAYINYDQTSLPSIGVGVGISGLENLLNGEFNPDKYAHFVATVGVDLTGSTSISIKLGRVLGPNQQIGFIVDRKTFVGNVNLLQTTKVRTYLDGTWQDEMTEWGLLGVDLIGNGDYQYLMINPKYPYDEVELTFSSLVSALNTMKIYSVFVRNDSDGDGLPDCIDPNPCSDELTGLSVNPSDICEGEDVILSGSANFSELPKSYQVFVHDGTTEYDMGTLTINDNGAFTYQIKDLSAGIYSLKLIEDLPANSTEQPVEYEGLSFKVHPTRTKWIPTEPSTDWNEWTNWSEGSPWTCTDVIIPSDADTYPVLKSGVMNGCRYIHFEPNAEVVNTHRLTYEKAWVELALHPNRYYMVTVPLKDTYSGDWFIPQTEPTTGMTVQYPEVFSVLDDQSLPENRVTPTVYQRVWAFKTYNKFFDAQGNAQKETLAATTHWSAPYNYLATPYDKNEGGYDYNAVSVWVHPFRPDATEDDDLDDLTYTFRFPKEHTLYQYYDEHGTGVNAYESIKREQPGRFIYESKDSTFSFPDTMRFYANSETEDGKKLFLVGNPFMSHIDLTMFLLENPHITSIKIEGSDGNNYTSVLTGEGGTGIITVDGIKAIAPMQSFFVIQESDAPSCSITFTEKMLISKSVLQDETGLKNANIIRLTASASDTRSSAMIRFSASASDNYREREDAEILIENETPPAVAIFTTAEDRALDIQQRANGGEIPLGMYLPKPEDVTLRIAVPDEYSGWMLEDVETNRRYPLMPGEETEIHVGRLTTNVGRFYLKGQSATGNETITATQPKLYCYREAGSHTLVVRSGSEMMTRCEVYGMDGRLRHIGQFETDEYRFPAQKGVQIVKAYFKDGITSTVKVF